MPSPAIRLRQLMLAEELLRRRRTDDFERYVEVFRRSSIDPNPHQVEAVIFALERLSEGGALLCDEVGLGKTIEAGLVLTQLKTEGRGHVLIIVPLPLARQWQVEMRDLFSLKTTILSMTNLDKHTKRGIYIAGREFATSPRYAEELARRGPWDLLVVDEAHEMLSGAHKRFGKRDIRPKEDPRKGVARRAAWLMHIQAQAPALLLTATPLQNSLYELWSLVHFVDPRHLVLGHLNEFCQLYAGPGGRSLRPNAEGELRDRLGFVVQRTLRRQAAEHMKLPFTKRHCETVNFNLQAAERELYEEVSRWLQKQSVYKPQSRRLVMLQVTRRMASSLHALASNLTRMKEFARTSSQGEWEKVEEDSLELTRMEARARQLLAQGTNKFTVLWELLEKIAHHSLTGVVNDKVVIFTESRQTLQGLVAFLTEKGIGDQVTAFSGTNEGPRAEEALRRWEQEVAAHLDERERPERTSAVRAALVHEFKTRTRVLIATEAGAKGLNLQFCNCLINFDLPWNPQRIEQRIGRVHRYGQRHDVIIVNFINLDNEGEQRVYHLLNEKLQLFEGLLGSSDAILGAVVSTLDLETRIANIFSSCRTPESIREAFDRLELEIDAVERNRRSSHLAGRGGRLDEEVRARFARCSEELPQALSRRDEELLALLEAESPVLRKGVRGDRVLLEWRGVAYHLGPPQPSDEFGEPLHVGHSAVRQIIREARLARGCYRSEGDQALWEVYKVTLSGLEEEERLLVLGGPGLEEALASGQLERVEEVAEQHPELAAALRELEQAVEKEQEGRIERLLAALSGRRQDARMFLDAKERELQKALTEAEKRRRNATSTEVARAAAQASRKLSRELLDLHNQREERLWQIARELEQEERRIRGCRFVRASAERLFRLEQGR
ncbi:MAG: DNA helicase [Candidatus Xenobia bacterium]